MSIKNQEELLAQSADFFSTYVDIQHFGKYSVQITVLNGSSFTGSCTLQAANDYDSWSDVTGTTKSLSGSSDVQIYDVVDSSVGYTRVKVVVTTGSADFKIDWLLK